MILTVTPNPCVDKTLYVDELRRGEKHRDLRVSCVPGGKGCNVSRAVKALGHPTRALVIVGGPAGQHVVDMITQDDGVECLPVWVRGMTRTITTILEEGPHRQTPLFEPGPPVTDEEKNALLDTFREAVQDASVVTLNGAVTSPETLHDLYAACIQTAREAGAKVILDSYGPEFAAGLDAVPHVVKPNLEEAEALIGKPLRSTESQQDALSWFLDKGIEAIALSNGAEGLIFAHGTHRWKLMPPPIQEVNAVGSGDALVAGMAIGLDQGWDWEKSLRFGMGAGTANAMTWDIGHFEAAEVNRLAALVTLEAF